MNASGHHLKIGRIVIQTVLVLVVYMLIGFQFSPKQILHDDAMFPTPASIGTFDFPVPFATKHSSVNFVLGTNWNTTASQSALKEVLFNFIGPCVPIRKSGTVLGAVLAFCVNANEINRKRLFASGATPQEDTAFFASEV